MFCCVIKLTLQLYVQSQSNHTFTSVRHNVIRKDCTVNRFFTHSQFSKRAREKEFKLLSDTEVREIEHRYDQYEHASKKETEPQPDFSVSRDRHHCNHVRPPEDTAFTADNAKTRRSPRQPTHEYQL